MVHENLRVFDKKDRQILYELDKNCRKSDAEIGRIVKLSKQAVRNRIIKLQKRNFLTRFASVIDTYKLGWFKFKLYLAFRDADRSQIKNITDYLVKSENTEWVASCSGKWDCITGFLVRSPYDFHEALKKFEEKFSGYIRFRETTISLGVPHWNKEYLLDTKPPFSFVQQGGFLGSYTLDKIDEKLLKLIVNNARLHIVDISKRLGLTPKTVNYRIQKLKKERIILKQRIFLNLPKLNFIFCKALIKFKDLTEKRYTQFFQACSDIPYLVYLINSIGSWDVELDFEIPNFNLFHEIMLDLRDRFADIIDFYEFVIVLKEEKLDYYPGAVPPIKLMHQPSNPIMRSP